MGQEHPLVDAVREGVEVGQQAGEVAAGGVGEHRGAGISGANLHDSQALIPLVEGIPPTRSRRGRRRRKPGKLHADKGYDYAHLRQWLRERGVMHRIARKGVESSQRPGRHRWTVERTMAWLAGCRRLY